MKPGNEDTSPTERSVLDRFFQGLSECIFHTKLGVVDVQLVDYLSDLMSRFVRVESLHRVRRSNGQPVTEVLQMFSEAETRIGLARREVHRHIGDFTLFWSGMYPERLRRDEAGIGDGFVSYCQQGKRAYAIAAEIEGGDDRPPCELLQQLSEQFELCAYGLREVRREWEDSGTGGDGLLLS